MGKEIYEGLKEKYDRDVQPYWKDNHVYACMEFGNFFFAVINDADKIKEYHSGLMFIAHAKVINDIINNKMNFTDLEQKIISEKDVAEFEGYFAQFGLSTKSNNKF